MNDETKKTATMRSDKTQTKKITGDDSVKIQQLFKLMVDNGASDLHISTGTSPAMRINGEIVRVKISTLNAETSKDLVYQVMTEEQKNEFEKNLDLDFSFGIKGLARFRANVSYSKGCVTAVFRLIPSIVPDFKSLSLPKVILDMTNKTSGLILITGPTGSGKSTTMAALIDKLNEQEAGHIITLEDPIEFVHPHKTSIVNQREIGRDSMNFSNALKALLRQDPDIVLVGELRDRETIEAALTIAETGHLVFGTLHTNSCVQTINRIVNVFPADQKDQIRTLLSFVLQGVVSQQLVPKSYEPGRLLAMEVLIPTPAIKNLIREDKIHQVYSQMQVGQEKSGMFTMNQSLRKHVDVGAIDAETAISFSTNPEELAPQLGIKDR